MVPFSEARHGAGIWRSGKNLAKPSSAIREVGATQVRIDFGQRHDQFLRTPSVGLGFSFDDEGELFKLPKVPVFI